MEQVHRMMVVTATALAVIVAPIATTAGPQKTDRPELQRQLGHVVESGAVGAMALVRDGRRFWQGNSGSAELRQQRPVPVDGRFRVGSITKTFTATVVLQLVGENRLRLEDPIEVWLPGVVPDGHRITVHHLLNHTSGVYNYLYTLPMPPHRAFFENRWRTWTPTELVQRAVANPPSFEPPGSAFAYSNTGYTLLGQIIEEVTGRPYGQEIESRIIGPLKLHQTSVPGTDPEIRGPHPRGYVPIIQNGGMRLLDYTETNPSVFGASGEIISTTRDLNRFLFELLGGRLLPAHLLDEMKTAGVNGRRYGLGLAWHDTSCGVRVFGNDGDALAYQSWSCSTEDQRRQVTIALTPDLRRDRDDISTTPSTHCLTRSSADDPRLSDYADFYGRQPPPPAIPLSPAYSGSKARGGLHLNELWVVGRI